MRFSLAISSIWLEAHSPVPAHQPVRFLCREDRVHSVQHLQVCGRTKRGGFPRPPLLFWRSTGLLSCSISVGQAQQAFD